MVTSPKIKQQWPSLNLSLNITRNGKNSTALFLYTISAARSKKKPRTRVQVKDIKLRFFKNLFLLTFNSKILYCGLQNKIIKTLSPEQQNFVWLKPSKAMLFD